jgi:hypothetical protein
MIYFATRSKAREFAAIKGRKVSDLGATSPKRWGVKVI